MEADKIKINTVIISILAIAAIEIIVRLVVHQNLIAPLIGLGLARLAEIILLLIIVKAQQQNIAIIGLALPKFYSGLKKGLIWAVSFGVAAGIVLLIIHLAGINLSGLFQMRLPFESKRLITFLLVGALIALVVLSGLVLKMTDSYFRRRPWIENAEAHQRWVDQQREERRKRHET